MSGWKPNERTLAIARGRIEEKLSEASELRAQAATLEASAQQVARAWQLPDPVRRDPDASLLREECEALGLPVSLKVLLRHIRNNHASIVGAKDHSIARLDASREGVDELLVAGDYMQSSLSRLAEYVGKLDYAKLPYRVAMALQEGHTAVEQWTEARRKA